MLQSAQLVGLVWCCVVVRDLVTAGADRPPCSGRGLRTGSQLCCCVGRWRSTPAISVAGEEGEDGDEQRICGHISSGADIFSFVNVRLIILKHCAVLSDGTDNTWFIHIGVDY